MSIFDLASDPLPKDWFVYELHIEVKCTSFELIEHLEKSKWIHFADGGDISGSIDGDFYDNRTRWYGLNKKNIL